MTATPVAENVKPRKHLNPVTLEKTMKAILVILAMMFSMTAKANDLEELLKGKVVVYNGACWFDKNGKLTFKDKDKKVVERCVVGMELPDQTKHYILIFKDGQPTKLILYNEKENSQKTLWLKNGV